MMAIANDDAVESSLAMLGKFDDAGMDRRLARFRDRLRELRDDPVEAARIDALVAEAEQEEQDPEVASASGLTIHMDGGVVNVFRGDVAQDPAAQDELDERADAVQLALNRHRDALAAVQAGGKSRARPRRPWDAVLAPAFGGGVLVAILATATVVIALHTTVAAMTAVASVLALTTAAAALVSVWMPLSSVRELNRHGGARSALELLSRGTGFDEARQQLEHAEMLVARARQFAAEDREAQWAREDRNSDLEWERAQRAVENREAARRRRRLRTRHSFRG
jgi:hypothetical protein